MKNLFKIPFNCLFVGILFLLIALNFTASYSENVFFLEFTKVLFIPALLIVFFIYNKKIAIPFALFFLVSFLGDSASIIFSEDISTKVSSLMYSLSYFSLIAFIAPKFIITKFNKVILLYLLVVLIINSYFLYTICSILNVILSDSIEVLLFGVKSSLLILLTFIAFGMYLNAESKQSITLLMVVLCFGFSDILNYVTQYYVYNWSFLMLDRLFYITGLYCFFNYTRIYSELIMNLKPVYRITIEHDVSFKQL